MAKVKILKHPRSVYCCQACGHSEARWLGRCPACQEWNSLVEEVATVEPARASMNGVADGQAPISITDVSEHSGGPRRVSGIAELDRVLGGGLVAGSMILLGGDPGIGKSTLLIQALAGLAVHGSDQPGVDDHSPRADASGTAGPSHAARALDRAAERHGAAGDPSTRTNAVDTARVDDHAARIEVGATRTNAVDTAGPSRTARALDRGADEPGAAGDRSTRIEVGATRMRVLYATGEESVAQTAMRARRVGAARDSISIVAETDVEKILGHARAAQPAILAVDSIQTVYTAMLDSIPGSLAQVRECASRLTQYAKTTGTPTIVVGHVTKDGALAGPKTLEHLVDVVLQLEGDGGPYRILRSHKNRFGSTQEIGVFEMRGAGMAEVANPSAHLLAERPLGAPGSVVVASADGARPLLVEIQALVAPASAGLGRRTAAGVDGNRVSLLLAVLAQRAACDVLDRDVFVNVAGGIRLNEPAIDLGVACAIASSARGRAIDPHTVMFGEVGLAGEIRAVTLCEQRLAEAARLGFKRALVPKQNAARLADHEASGLEIIAVDRLQTAINEL